MSGPVPPGGEAGRCIAGAPEAPGARPAARPAPGPLPRPVLVAGMGNVLHEDDGFGPRVAELLESGGLPEGVRVVDVGIGGIHLVQELMDGYASLVLLDAVDGDRPPGTVTVLEPRVPDQTELERAGERFFAETHYAVPAKALILAKALSVLPERVYIIGCQPLVTGLGLGISETVERAVEAGAREVRRLLEVEGASRA